MATRITKTHLLIFALPAMVSAIMHGPIAGIIPSLYATDFGLDLAVIGTVLLVARMFDAVTDPLIGYLSDRTNSRYGKRKPWIVAGSLMTVVCIWFLFRPGESVSMGYFLAFSVLLYLAWTVMEIPYVAWILEMSRESVQRTRINASRTAALFIGGIIFYLLPQFVPGSNGSMNFHVLGLLAIGIAIAIPITTGLMVRFVPQGDVFQSTEKPRLSELWASIKGNWPFRSFILAYAFIGLASGVAGVLSFMYIDTYLQIGHRFTELFLPSVIIGPLILPFWVWVLNKFGKNRTTAVAFVVYALIMPLPWFIEPGEGAFIPMLIIFTAGSMFMPLLMVSMPSILGDVIDYDELQTGKNRGGQYYSFLALIAKGTVAIGGPLALLVIGLFGYQPGAPANDDTAIFGLRVVYNLVPPLILVPGIVLLWSFPITDEKQREIKSRLEARGRNDADELLPEPA